MGKQRLFINEFALKIVALVTMTASHIGYMLVSQGFFAEGTAGYQTGVVLQYIGRLAFPLFAFMLAEGLRKTKNRDNYLLRLALMCGSIVLVQLIFFLIDRSKASGMEGNAFLDLLLGASTVYFLEKSKKPLRFLALLPFSYLILCYSMDLSEIYAVANNQISAWSINYPLFLRPSYSLFGYLMILLFYYSKPVTEGLIHQMAKDEEIYQQVATEGRVQGFSNSFCAVILVLLNLVFWALARTGLPDPYLMGVESYSALAALLILFYNGKRGYDRKWWRIFNYAYYPAHLVLIWAVFALCSL